MYNLPNAVFEAVMGSSWEHKITPSKLTEITETLELWCVHDLYTQWVHGDMTVDRVIKHLKHKSTSWTLCCRMTPGLSKDILCHV